MAYLGDPPPSREPFPPPDPFGDEGIKLPQDRGLGLGLALLFGLLFWALLFVALFDLWELLRWVLP